MHEHVAWDSLFDAVMMVQSWLLHCAQNGHHFIVFASGHA